MNFLRTLFWVVIAVSLAIFATRNWIDVSVSLWGGIQADIKLPALLLLIFLIGFLPTYFIMRGRLWSLNRKLLLAQGPTIAPVAAPQPADKEEEPA